MRTADYKQRIESSCAALKGADYDFLYLTNLASIRWLTGFAGSAGSLLLSARSATLFVDNRYDRYATSILKAASLDKVVVVASTTGTFEKVSSMVGSCRMVCESAFLQAGEYQRMQQAFKEKASLRLVETHVVEDLRNKKDLYELEKTRTALRIAEEAFIAVENSTLPITEKELQRKIDAQMLLLGADRPAFETIVASGIHSIEPHSKPTEKLIVPGELVIVDWGAEVDGYRSDTSRTIWWGQLDASKQKIYDAVYETLVQMMDCIKVGVSYGSIMRTATEKLREDGMADFIQHPFGHNVGLEIHERPFFSIEEETEITRGSLLAFEPAVYVPDSGGVRLENMLYVGPDKTEILNRLPYRR